MARPRYAGKIHRIRLTLCLREGEHDDLIKALQQVPKGKTAGAVIAMMRQGVSETAVSDINEEDAVATLDNLMF